MEIRMLAIRAAAGRRLDGLGYRVRILRKAAGMSQCELANKANMALSHVSLIETKATKRIRYATLKALAKALGVKPHVLTGLPRVGDLNVNEDGWYLLRAYASMCA